MPLLPVVTLTDVFPILKKGEKVYTYGAGGTLPNGRVIGFYESKGLDLTEYIGKEMECVIEITQGEIIDPKYEDVDFKCFPATYILPEMSFVFFPELIKLRLDIESADQFTLERYEELYSKAANEVYDSWGINGFDIDPYSYRSMLSIFGYQFYINEYEFEEQLDRLNIEDEFHIRIDEFYLRGIRPYIPPEDRAPKLTEAQKAEQARRQALYQERLAAYEAMQERIRIRRANGEGPSLV